MRSTRLSIVWRSPASTDKRIDHDLHHYFRFDGGKIADYRGTEDTAQTVAALQP